MNPPPERSQPRAVMPAAKSKASRPERGQTDQYCQALTFSYNGTNGLLQTVTDWKNRSLTFTYAGSPLRLTSVSYGYTTNYNAQGDLTSMTDSEQKTSNFLYDTNHQLVATKDALNQIVVSNVYDGFGRVITQYTQGDTNKTWQIYLSGWETVEQDPAGGKRRFFFDDHSRLVGLQDALGNLNQTFYDGQDHVVMTVSPMNETNRFIYDGNHNLIYTIDPLGYTHQFVYPDS